ncbi:MAG: helix-turn-helix domain-containing protein, partial [Verrucomicrobiae bacterium]|nr:helix-turn-helix domain-containing protein [Verrucomicrobiae bacterium]
LGALRTVEPPQRPPSPLAVGSAMAGFAPALSNASAPSSADPDRFPTLNELERDHILAALRRCNDNRTHAARILGISVRTLRNKLKEYGYSRAASREAARAQPDSASA